MNTRKWEAQWDNNRIVVSNGWDWSGNSEEKIEINDEVVLGRSYDVTKVTMSRASGTVFNLEYGTDKIKVKLGYAWHLLGMACRIEVNGKYIGGDKIVLFAKETN